MNLTAWFKSTLLLLLLALVACQPKPSPSVNQLNIAQLTEPTDNGSGIGGTGLMPTGDSGIGGTGIVGVITGFGSIWVNGVRIEVNDQTRLLTPWGDMPAQDLAVGHQVVVQTETDSNRPLNNQLQLLMPLNGEVSALNHEQGHFSLLGQTVHFSAETQFVSELKVGEKVTVSGFYQAENQWLATRVEPARSDSAYLQAMDQPIEWAETTRQLLLQGYVQSADKGQSALHQAWRLHGQSMVTADKLSLEVGQLQLMRVERDHQHFRVEQVQRMDQWLRVWPDKMRQTQTKPQGFKHWQQQGEQRQLMHEMRQPLRQQRQPMRSQDMSRGR